MAEFIYSMYKTRKAHGDKVILDDVTLNFLPGAKIGVVGPNGAGKSTILKIMAGLDQPSNGEARLSPGYTVGILQQEPPLNEAKTVLGNVEEGVAEIKGKLDRYNEISELMSEPDADFDALLAEMGQLQEAIDAADAWDLDAQLDQAMDALRCPPPDADVTVLSGGERRRVALCKLLLEKPDLLLLDEPTNHLDAESVLWLEAHLKDYPGAILAVTHDRYFLDHVAEWICEVDRGRLYPYEGNYSTYLEKKGERLAIQGKKDLKLAKRLKDELEWVRSNAKGRQTKSKSRLARYEEMAAEADRTRKLDFEEIQIPPGPRLGSIVLEAKNLGKGFDGRVLIDDLSFTLPRNGIVGVIGPNGVGKTTLFKTIVGLEPLDKGELKVGETVSISYVDQSRGGIDPKKTLFEVVSDGLDFLKVGNVEMPSRAYVAAFGFKGPDQQKPAGVLSGGERNRLNLALTLKQGGNLLLLDEPTNDLDVETLGSLENALLEFPGCAVVVSHDRWFLDRVATHILAYEGTEDEPGNWYWFEGNFASYEENKVERLGADAARPHRVTYRKLRRD
ncbi:energy-dependent translational throttle protein EttA [Cellulomonas sp. Root137]|uniref:energy-dependent translational throttle protein EttA n=1 Tax=Cellulomonas sp. Root137 TaxID=1736459 RepID=UPI0006F5D485|nr:energy-dependent translational throttle protein EttA [Cellulomonas sp. Root137]KQY44512.1 ABC transporter ATP-binding protein [Cellulomonas sp. Root137]KRD41519.1 ABC transporter ATP-binding protein [Cellulomonas sp. Root930]